MTSNFEEIWKHEKSTARTKILQSDSHVFCQTSSMEDSSGLDKWHFSNQNSMPKLPFKI